MIHTDKRIFKKVTDSAQTTHELYIKDALGRDLSIVKFVTTGSTTTQSTEYFVHGTDRVARVLPINTTDQKVQPDEATYFLYDHLGNTRVAFQVDSVNVPLIINALDYYAYGKDDPGAIHPGSAGLNIGFGYYTLKFNPIAGIVYTGVELLYPGGWCGDAKNEGAIRKMAGMHDRNKAILGSSQPFFNLHRDPGGGK